MLEVSLSPQYKNLTEGTRDKTPGIQRSHKLQKEKSTSVQLGIKMASDFSKAVLETRKQCNNVLNILDKMVLTQIFMMSLSINQI